MQPWRPFYRSRIVRGVRAASVGLIGVRENSHDDVSLATCLIIQAQKIQTKNLGKEM